MCWSDSSRGCGVQQCCNDRCCGCGDWCCGQESEHNRPVELKRRGHKTNGNIRRVSTPHKARGASSRQKNCATTANSADLGSAIAVSAESSSTPSHDTSHETSGAINTLNPNSQAGPSHSRDYSSSSGAIFVPPVKMDLPFLEPIVDPDNADVE